MNTLPSLCFPPLYIPSNYLLIFFFNFLLCPSMTTNSHSNYSPCILSAHFHFCSPFTFLLFFLSVFISFCFTSLYCMAISICTYFSPFSFNLNKTKVFYGNKFVYHILSLGLVVSVCVHAGVFYQNVPSICFQSQKCTSFHLLMQAVMKSLPLRFWNNPKPGYDYRTKPAYD